MHISELRSEALKLREHIYLAQDAHPRVGVLTELAHAAESVYYNLAMLDEVERGEPVQDRLVRAGWCLGRVQVLATIAYARFTTKKLLPLRPQAERWVLRSRELMDLLGSAELPARQLEEVVA